MRKLGYYLAFVMVILGCAWSCVNHQNQESAPKFDEELPSRVHASIAKVSDLIGEGHLNEAFVVISDTERALDTLSQTVRNARFPASDIYRLKVYKANIYSNYHDYASAAKYYRMALPYADAMADSIRLLLNLSVMSCHSADSAGAAEAAKEIAELPIVEPADVDYREYANAVSAGYVEKFFGDRERSKDRFEEALRVARTKGLNIYSNITAVSELYEYYSFVDSIDKMMPMLEEYRRLADKAHIPEMMADVEKGFLKAYIIRGDTMRAMDSYEAYFSIVDTLYNSKDFSAISTKYKDADLNRTTDRMMRLELTVSRQKMVIISIIIGLILIIGIWLVIRNVMENRRRIEYLNREIARSDEAPGRLALPMPAVSESNPENDRHAELMNEIARVLSDVSVVCDPDLSINSLADRVKSNTKYVSQAINDTTGMNFRSYINSLRIKIARTRLTDSGEYANQTIQAVSESVGFRSTSNFVLAFKKVMGVTPSAYQKLAKSGK